MDSEFEIESKDIVSKTRDDDVRTRSLTLIANVLWEIQKHLEILADAAAWKGE